MGENAGKLGNKITGFAAVRPSKKDKNRPQPVAVNAGTAPGVVGYEDLPF